MRASTNRTHFSFDFTQAGRIGWSHGRRNELLDSVGKPTTFSIDDHEIATRFSSAIEPTMADFVDIAVAVHMADRLAVRTLNAAANWSREIHLQLAVRDPNKWNESELQERLKSLLRFLTEDTWSFQFIPLRDVRRPSETQPYLFSSDSPAPFSASLFSGGLDSLAGSVAAISSAPNEHFVLISATPNVRQRARQQQQVEMLRRDCGASLSHVSIPYGMKDGDQFAQEPSRRTRGFLFLILGGVSALSAGCLSLSVFENGIGALNLPYDQSQIGTDNARAVHPRVLRLVSDLLSRATEKPFSIVNPCVFSTKAQMLRHPAVRQLSQAIALTFSCDGFPVRAHGKAQCGFCTSCLLRRFSLELAGLDHFDAQEYLRDWKLHSFPTSKHHLQGLRAMDWQALRFRRCFSDPDPWAALTLEFPELRAGVHELSQLHHESPADSAAKLRRLIEQHVQDWPSFSALPLLNSADTKAA
jgi:hypothetical protein